MTVFTRICIVSAMMTIIFGASIADAGMSWDSERIEQEAIHGDTAASAVFRFRNSGKTPVHIRNVRPSCNCTATGLDQTTYEVGERGTLKLTTPIG